MKLTDLEPKAPFKYFLELSGIPRGSGNEKASSDYVMGFARERGLEAWQDEAFNVVIRKPATPGFENAPRVIIQGHIDMVCEKDKGIDHDFTKDGLNIVVDGEYIRASGTTLGADDGVAVAYGIALLAADDIPHPPLTVIITTGEEIGLLGAAALDPAYLEGDMLINLDAGGDGIFVGGCAGGARCTLTLKGETGLVTETDAIYEITVAGLQGGHSGGDIKKERGNANKILGRLLYGLIDYNPQIISIEGGEKENAIPRDASALVSVSAAYETVFQEKLLMLAEEIRSEHAISDPGLVFIHKAHKDKQRKAFNAECSRTIIETLVMLPSGVMHMEQALPEFVETSVSIGVVRTDDQAGSVTFFASVRSSVASRKAEVIQTLRAIAAQTGAAFSTGSDYPAWKYNQKSAIRDICAETYKELFGKEPQFLAVHGGLECGLFAEKRPGLDMVAFGPDMYDYHSPKERLDIKSFGRTWELIKAVLRNIK
ncbi:MAG: aminoacyl-histidine dipeptidase [Clostridiales bacterium]|nr:aminoacyl-histidine dipeptidase [Clostridiales bacterium]